MAARGTLVGRRAELGRLSAALDRARQGAGSILLLSGDAGVGKTRLLGELARNEADALVLQGAAAQTGTAPYGVVVAALRAGLRADPSALDGCGPLAAHLAMILPELGAPAQSSDRATLIEAIRCALAHLAQDRPLVLILDDRQYSAGAPLELLSALAEPLGELSVLVLAVYRSDGLPRDHSLRRLRHELRRAGRLEELAVQPLGQDEVAELLASVVGSRPAGSLVKSVHDTTQGTP